MRDQELWRRLNRHLGAAEARSWADHVVLGDLDNRTITEALDADQIGAVIADPPEWLVRERESYREVVAEKARVKAQREG